MKTHVRVFSLVSMLAVIFSGAVVISAQTPDATRAAGKGGAASPGAIPNATEAQAKAVGAINLATLNLLTAVSTARTELATAAFSGKKDEALIRAKVDALAQAELKLALSRADEFGRLQASANKLTPEQIAAVVTDSVTRPIRGVQFVGKEGKK